MPVLEETRLKLPVDIEILDGKHTDGVPFISLEAWMEYIMKYEDVFTLIGDARGEDAAKMLKDYWTLLRPLEPDLEVFQMFDKAEADPESTIPMTCHIDEGRGTLASLTYTMRLV